MNKNSILSVIVLIVFTGCNKNTDLESLNTDIKKTIENSIGWALNKDTSLLYSIMFHDDDLLIINPDSSQIKGFEAFRKQTNSVWMSPKFKATHFEVKKLKITLSRKKDVAWFYCNLDDFVEWDGQKTGWENVRWTGVLELTENRWKFRQMHFSFPVEDND